MSNLSRQVWAYVGALAAVLLFIALYGVPLRPFTWVKAVTGAVAVTAAAFLLWDNLLWKIPPFPALTGHVNVGGTWKGRLASQYHTNVQAAAGGCEVKATEIDVFLVVRQRFSSITIHQFTATSSGEGQVSHYARNGNGRVEAVMVYTNDPHQAGPLEPHRGTVHYIFDRSQERITAKYWTNRFSRGTITFDRHVKSHADTPEGAAALFG